MLDGFMWGDYLHSEVVNKKGEKEGFANTDEDACFMALHKGEELAIEYDVTCEYVNEGAGYYPWTRITQIKAKKDDLKSWQKNFNFTRDNPACEKEIEKYTHER
jgi:hypothetical protein